MPALRRLARQSAYEIKQGFRFIFDAQRPRPRCLLRNPRARSFFFLLLQICISGLAETRDQSRRQPFWGFVGKGGQAESMISPDWFEARRGGKAAGLPSVGASSTALRLPRRHLVDEISTPKKALGG